MPATLSQLVKYLRDHHQACIDVLQVTHHIGKTLNSPTDRFFKAELIDKSYSTLLSEIAYVDQKGHDFLFKGAKISHKSQSRAFLKNLTSTSDLAIANTMGDKQGRDAKLSNDFDFLIITQTSAPFAIAVCSHAAVKKNARPTNDQIKAKIPVSDLSFIVHPIDGVSFSGTLPLNIKDEKNKMVAEIIRHIVAVMPKEH